MGDLINLRQARKRKDRNDADRLAAENRGLHGQFKADKVARRLEQEKAASHLDSHLLTSPEITRQGTPQDDPHPDGDR